MAYDCKHRHDDTQYWCEGCGYYGCKLPSHLFCNHYHSAVKPTYLDTITVKTSVAFNLGDLVYDDYKNRGIIVRLYMLPKNPYGVEGADIFWECKDDVERGVYLNRVTK